MRKLTAFFTSLLFAALMLSGCKAAPSQSAPSSEPADEPPAKGAYIEVDHSEKLPPELLNSIIWEMRCDADGVLRIVSLRDELSLWEKDENGNWNLAARVKVPAEHGIDQRSRMTLSSDGTFWGVGDGDSPGNASLYRGKPDENGALSLEQIPLPWPEGTKQGFVSGIRMQPDGSLITLGYYHDPVTAEGHSCVFFIQPNGSCVRLEEPEQAPFGSQLHSTPTFYDNGKLWQINLAAGLLIEFDPQTGNVQNIHRLDFGAAFQPGGLEFSNIQNGMLSFVNKSGIYQTAIGGSLVQSFANDRSFGIADPQVDLRILAEDADSSFWVQGRVDGNSNEADHNVLYEYSYDPEYVSPRTKELVVWTMYDHPALTTMVRQFQKDNPEYSVKIECGQDSITETVKPADVLAEMNQRILAGNGPDLVVLDQLCAGAFIQNGLLLDLSGALTTEGLYPVAQNCWQEGEALYAVPLAIQPSLMFASDEALAKTISGAESLSDLVPVIAALDIFKEKDPAYALPPYDYDWLFGALYPTASGRIFPLTTTEVNEDALKEFLNATAEISAKAGLSGKHTNPYNLDGRFRYSWGKGSYYTDPVNSWDAADPALMLGSLSYYWDILQWADYPVCIRPLPGNSAKPILSLAVLKGSQHKEKAAELACCLQSAASSIPQRSAFTNGIFSARPEKLPPIGKADGAETPDFGQDQALLAAIDQITTAANNDGILREIVFSEAEKLYKGTQDVQVTSDNIVNQAQQYYQSLNALK